MKVSQEHIPPMYTTIGGPQKRRKVHRPSDELFAALFQRLFVSLPTFRAVIATILFEPELEGRSAIERDYHDSQD
jgi:hypothetical protein